uniref:EGF-like domain-containing protein n=1 Tax=Meloidogyne hapla TaxID=6305 RepID=A0A1I8BRQ7_MELHA
MASLLLLSHPIETSGARCASPTRMERRRVVTSSVEQFKCLGIESLVTVGAGKCLLDNEEACPTGCKCTSINNYFDHQQPKHLNNHRFRHRRRRLLFRHRREEIKFKHNSVIVQCSNASLVDIPWPLPQNTEELLLDNNKIGIIKIENFMGLEHLRKLDLSHNLIEHIPSNVFSPLKSLNALMLSNNRIRCLSQGAFDELGQLRILSLQSNLITKLPENVFSKFVLETQQTLSHVSLGDNPLLCDCEMNWAIKWLRSKFLEPGIARCSGPPERRQQLLLSVQPYAPCPTLNITNNVQEDLCNICSPEKCLNGGHCVVDEGNGENFPLQFKCICAPGWHGKLCEQQVDACFGHPCRNGGKCIVKIGENKLLYEGRFNCICLRGFAGERCERQINECVEKGGKERCLNGGKCLDQLNGFRCECPKGWIGNFCEFNLCGTSLIQNNNCSLIKENELIKSSFLSVSRMERANNEGKKFAKRNFCPFNYADPPKCNRRRAVAIKATNTFLSLGQWPINNFNNSIINGEISFHFATNQSDGTMFWLGDKHDDSFILLELMRGRLRAAIQLGKGHEPYSQLYSMNIVSDSKSHWLVIGIYGQKFYLTVDDFPTQFAINTGPLNFFPNEFLEIYFGGVPADLGRRALVHFKISDASSIIGK